jgi:hypothetical protein
MRGQRNLSPVLFYHSPIGLGTGPMEINNNNYY